MCSNYSCVYLGSIPNISMMSSAENGENRSGNSNRRGEDPAQSTFRSSDVQLIDRIDNAQLDGRLPYTSSVDEHGVTLTISKHGLKIVESPSRGENVLDRIPLHVIAQAVSYEDGSARWNVAVKTGQVGKNQFTCHVFQMKDEAEAEAVCQSVRQVFAKVGTSD